METLYFTGYVDEYNSVYYDLPIKFDNYRKNNLDKIINKAKDLFDNSDYKTVIVFEITKDDIENPEIDINWEYMESHKVKSYE